MQVLSSYVVHVNQGDIDFNSNPKTGVVKFKGSL